VTLESANEHQPTGATVVSTDAGLTVEECANKVLEAGSPCGSDAQYMSYSEQEGCSCYATVDKNAWVALTGTHMFKIDQKVPAAITQTPRLIKEQAYCTKHHYVGSAASAD
jgi:hypothetical protein